MKRSLFATVSIMSILVTGTYGGAGNPSDKGKSAKPEEPLTLEEGFQEVEAFFFSSQEIPEVRETFKLGMTGDREALLKTLRNPSSHVQHAAATSLALCCGDRSGIPVLKKQLESGNVFEKLRAAGTLVAVGEENGVATSIELLSHEHVGIRQFAFGILQQGFNKSFDYESDSSQQEREVAISKWKNWWNSQPDKGALLRKRTASFLLENAKATEKAGASSDALRQYRALISLFSDSPEAEEARQKVKALEKIQSKKK